MINTILLITPDTSGEVVALIQLGETPFPTIVQAGSPQALEDAWNKQKNNEIFYDAVYSVCVNDELSEKMRELGIKDGTYTKVDVTLNISTEVKRYRLSNRSETYEIREDYFGWLPENHKNWELLTLKFIDNTELTIVNPKDKVKKILYLHHFIIKDAFPMSFLLEEISEKWGVFAIVSETINSEKFIIPIY